jgi:hypothetical protein
MDRYNKLLGVSETRQTDSGSMQITSANNILIQGEQMDTWYNRGVGIKKDAL